METTDTRERQPPDRNLSRRRLLAGGFGMATAVFSPGIAGAQTEGEDGAGQPENEDGSGSDGGDESTQPEDDGSIVTETALSASTPTFDRENHEGLFVEIRGESNSRVEQGVTACEFLGTNPVPYEITLFNPASDEGTGETEGDDPASESALMYAAENDEEIKPETFFLINRSQPCSDEFLAVGLGEADKESIESDVGPGTGQEGEPGA